MALSSNRDELRLEVLAWLEANWDPELTVAEWWERVAKAGWVAPHLPEEQGGRGLHSSSVNTVRVAFTQAGALRPPGGLGLLMAAPTILTHGTPDQIARLVPAILSGWLLSFTLSLDDLVTSSFVTGPGATTLPMVIFSKVRLGLNPEINALATIIIALVGGGVIIASLLMSQQERRRQRDVQMAIAANQ